MTRSIFTIALLSVTALTACSDETVPEGAIYDYSTRTAAEEAGMLAFLNDYTVSTRSVLDNECRFHSDSAKHLDNIL